MSCRLWCGVECGILTSRIILTPPFGVGTGLSEYTSAVRRVLGVRGGRDGGAASMCGMRGGGVQVWAAGCGISLTLIFWPF